MDNPKAPQFVCADCYENVVNACSFKRVLEESDKKVRLYLEQNDAEESSLKIEYLEAETAELSKDETFTEEYLFDELEEEYLSSEDDMEYDSSPNQTLRVSKDKLEVQKCYICNLDFSNKIQKLAHFREHHTEEESLKCLQCNHIAKNAVFLNVHLKNHEKLFPCNKCSRKFATESILELHKLNDNCVMKQSGSGRKKLHCSDCKQSFSRNKDYEHHMNQKVDIEDCSTIQPIPVQCYLCNATFKYHYLKKAHLEEAHPTEDPWKCHVCGSISKSAKHLDRHLMIHFEGIPEVICEQCGRKFEHADLLKKHIHTAHSERPHYSCDICGVSVTLKQSILRHMKSVHMKIFKYHCLECGPGYSYSNRTSYNAHLFRTHGKKAPIQCPDCQMGFTFSYELKNHKGKQGHCGKTKEYVRVIDKNNKIKWRAPKTWEYAYFSDKKGEIFCKVCHKKYTTTDNLMIHYKVQHQGFRFQCDQCDSSYSSRKGLRTHKITRHLNLRNYVCEVCSKDFNEKRNLDRHM